MGENVANKLVESDRIVRGVVGREQICSARHRIGGEEPRFVAMPGENGMDTTPRRAQ